MASRTLAVWWKRAPLKPARNGITADFPCYARGDLPLDQVNAGSASAQGGLSMWAFGGRLGARSRHSAVTLNGRCLIAMSASGR